ncbi:MAG: enoyl-CoA hydratase-related protein [Candidatus Kapaibacterium sp.]
MTNEYTCIRLSNPAPGVGAVELYRPTAMNALNMPMMDEIVDACSRFDVDESIGCIVIHGSEKVFAAGADIKEMEDADAVRMVKRDQFAVWERLRLIKKPIIAAVSGYALGGGCELAMLCDIIIASDTAQFGQPEINIGVMPGAGGTQRLTRALGKSLAMELILTGSMLSADRALAHGLVSRVVPKSVFLQEAVALAATIAGKPPFAVRLAKESVNAAIEQSLDAGLELERKNFYLLFASNDQKEGMAAFVEKRAPVWSGT